MTHAPDPPEAANYTGLKKIFNSTTLRGRANVSSSYIIKNEEYIHTVCYIRFKLFCYLLQVGMATYAGIGLIVAYFMLKPKKSK